MAKEKNKLKNSSSSNKLNEKKSFFAFWIYLVVILVLLGASYFLCGFTLGFWISLIVGVIFLGFSIYKLTENNPKCVKRLWILFMIILLIIFAVSYFLRSAPINLMQNQKNTDDNSIVPPSPSAQLTCEELTSKYGGKKLTISSSDAKVNGFVQLDIKSTAKYPCYLSATYFIKTTDSALPHTEEFVYLAPIHYVANLVETNEAKNDDDGSLLPIYCNKDKMIDLADDASIKTYSASSCTFDRKDMRTDSYYNRFSRSFTKDYDSNVDSLKGSFDYNIYDGKKHVYKINDANGPGFSERINLTETVSMESPTTYKLTIN